MVPFTKIIKVEASDADIGLNSEIYYSISERTPYFAIDPLTGWIINLRHLKPGDYNLILNAEDRASRLTKTKEHEDDDGNNDDDNDNLVQVRHNHNEAKLVSKTNVSY